MLRGNRSLTRRSLAGFCAEGKMREARMVVPVYQLSRFNRSLLNPATAPEHVSPGDFDDSAPDRFRRGLSAIVDFQLGEDVADLPLHMVL